MVLLTGMSGISNAEETAKSLRGVYNEAVAVWAMDSLKSTNCKYSLAIQGAVAVGAELVGKERAASIARAEMGR